MEKDRFVAGEFVWTGFDYIGEPAPYIAQGWGNFKPRKLAKDEESRIKFPSASWTSREFPRTGTTSIAAIGPPQKETIHILPHWNWPDRVGKNVPIYVYTGGDSAELFLNGKSLGKRTKKPKRGSAS